MKIVVTGSHGFLGTSVVAKLRSLDHVVFTVDIAVGADETAIDVCGPTFRHLLMEFAPDAVVHLAGVQYEKPVKKALREQFFKKNVQMAKSISEVALSLASLKQIVFVSTDMVYGRVEQTPVPVTAKPRPVGPYGASKLVAEDILRTLSKDQNIALTIFRPRLIAGEGRLGTIAILKQFIQRGFPVPIFGRGENRYQMVSKNDVANAISLALLRQKSGIFNLGSDDPPRVKELISHVISQTGSRSKRIFIPNGLLTRVLTIADSLNLSPLSPEQFEIAGIEYVLDTSETKIALGWEPTQSDKDILEESFRQ